MIISYFQEAIEKDGLPAETDAVINLCGHSIGMPGRFTDELKQAIRDSRISTNTTLRTAIEKAETPPSVFLAASAVGKPCSSCHCDTVLKTSVDKMDYLSAKYDITLPSILGHTLTPVIRTD